MFIRGNTIIVQQAQHICTASIQRRTSVEDAGPMLHQCHTNALRPLRGSTGPVAKGDSWTKRSGTPTACRQAGRQAAPLFFHTYSGEGEPLQAIEPPGREDEADYQGGVWCTPLVSARLLSGSGCRVKRWGG